MAEKICNEDLSKALHNIFDLPSIEQTTSYAVQALGFQAKKVKSNKERKLFRVAFGNYRECEQVLNQELRNCKGATNSPKTRS